MVSEYTLNGLHLRTGDIICTRDGKPDILPGEFWRLVGRLVPGDVDHIAIYIGPNGRCVESGALGVITFEVKGDTWDAEALLPQRGLLLDSLYGIAYPLEGRGLTTDQENEVREAVAKYCLDQVGKPYNLNFFASDSDESFYCSQLAYKAYQPHGINLNTGLSIDNVPGASQIIFPQEIWNGCAHTQVENFVLSHSK